MNRRRSMTDFQRIVIYFSVMAAVFLAAMGLGWQNMWLLLSAAVVLVVAVLGVALAVARRGAGRHELATARVLSVSDPPPNTGIAAKCDMTLEVHLANRAPVRTRHRDPAVPLTRWPQPGQTFPVDVYGGNPRRRMHIRWDLVEQGMARAPDGDSAGGASQVPLWEEEQEPVIYSPTPPRPRRPSGPPPAPPPTPPPAPSSSAPPPASAPPSPAPSPSKPAAPPAPAAPTAPPSSVEPPVTGVFLHETFVDIDDDTLRTPPPSPSPDRGRPSPRDLRPVPGESNGHDPDGYDPADFETPRLHASAPPPAVTGGPGFEPVSLTDFDPARVDIRDFTGEPPAVTPMPPDDDVAPPAIPSPRDPGDEARRSEEVSATLPVTDLARSLRFYRDALGFTVVVASTESAVVENGGTGVRLEQSSGVDSSRGEIHLDVTDIEMTCAIARELSGEVVEPPAPTHGVAGRQLWRARLRDPDGHAIEIVEWKTVEDRH